MIQVLSDIYRHEYGSLSFDMLGQNFHLKKIKYDEIDNTINDKVEVNGKLISIRSNFLLTYLLFPVHVSSGLLRAIIDISLQSEPFVEYLYDPSVEQIEYNVHDFFEAIYEYRFRFASLAMFDFRRFFVSYESLSM